MTDAISILSESVLSDGPSFVKKLEISQEVVSETDCLFIAIVWSDMKTTVSLATY